MNRGFFNGSAKTKEIFLRTAAATDDSELLSALVASAAEDEDESAKRGKQATDCTEILCFLLECKSYYPICSSR